MTIQPLGYCLEEVTYWAMKPLQLICQFLLPKTKIHRVKEWRRKSRADQNDFCQHWLLCISLHQTNTNGNGKKDKMMWIPVMTSLPPSPEAIHLFKCKCLMERCGTNHCQCRKAGLNFTQFFVAQATRTRMMMVTKMKMIIVIWEMMKTMMV